MLLDVDAILAKAKTEGRRYVLDGIEGNRIPAYQHGGGILLLPFAGDPELDRYYLAQMAREVIYDDMVRRNAALQRQRKALRRRR